MNTLNETGKAQIAKAMELGKQSYQKGLHLAGCKNQELINIVGYRMKKDTPKGECTFIDIMTAYNNSYTNMLIIDSRKICNK